MQTWLPLADYSSKYKVSISTLRRRIKAEDIDFTFDDGRYFILDSPLSTHRAHRPSQKSDVTNSVSATEQKSEKQKSKSANSKKVDKKAPPILIDDLAVSKKLIQQEAQLSKAISSEPSKNFQTKKNENKLDPKTETVINETSKLLVDLKSAYRQVLAEKEQQILKLRAEMADMKTLISVLEAENAKLKERYEGGYAQFSEADL